MQVSGRGTNVNFTIDDRAPFDAVMAGVEECLVKNRHLFSRGSITVNVGRRILAREQLTQIKRILEAESGLTVAQFWCSPEILEETLSDISPEPPQKLLDEVLDQETTVNSPDLPEYQPDSEISPALLGLARPDLDKDEEPDKAGESPGQTLPWPTPDFPNLPDPISLIPPFAEKEELAETEKVAVPSEDSGDGESQSSPEEDASGDSQAPMEPAAQISPGSAGDPKTESSPEISKEPAKKPIKEPAIQPIVEPGLLELALVGLEQTIAAGSAFEGGLESSQDVSPASLESRLEAASPKADLEVAGLGTDASTGAGVVTSISPHQETGGLNRQNEALLIKTTCRSGEVVRYPGDVVILADVNPGAEIIADGDILVVGSLRGLAHAGAGGDIQATIIALNLESPRIQIGPYIGMAPKAKKRSKSNRSGPTLAFVRRQHIFVAPFKGRFAGYSGGTIYDG